MTSEQHIKDRFEKLAANSFPPTWIADHTPLEGWPPGIDPSEYTYSSVAAPIEPEDDGVVPPLVLRARQMGLDV